MAYGGEKIGEEYLSHHRLELLGGHIVRGLQPIRVVLSQCCEKHGRTGIGSSQFLHGLADQRLTIIKT